MARKKSVREENAHFEGYELGRRAQADLDRVKLEQAQADHKERRLRLIEQVARDLGQAVDAMSHALQFVTREGVE